jgi:uncharacterized membrane protein
MTEPVSTGTQDRAGARRRFAIAGGLLLTVATGVWFLAALAASTRPRDQKSSLRDVVLQTIEAKGIDAAVAQYRQLREQGFPGLRESESETNSLGYKLLRKGEKESAIRVFQLNVETHPKSANVYDSLADAYLAAGNKAQAIENYEKTLAIAPRQKSAAYALEKLTDWKRPPHRPLVLLHITAGGLALLAGAGAMAFRKGSRRHAVAGSVFVACMLSMSASGAFMAFVAPDGAVVNVLMGTLTFYLVATSWLTARRRNGETGIVDWGALLVVLAVAASLAYYGLEAATTTGNKDGAPTAVFFVFGGVALLAGALDLRMIARGGVFGAQRLARHLWRMCVALFIAVTSLFLGQPQLFPDDVRKSGVLGLPSLLVVILLVFWLVRVLFTKAYKRTAPRRPEIIVGQVAT